LSALRIEEGGGVAGTQTRTQKQRHPRATNRRECEPERQFIFRGRPERKCDAHAGENFSARLVTAARSHKDRIASQVVMPEQKDPRLLPRVWQSIGGDVGKVIARRVPARESAYRPLADGR